MLMSLKAWSTACVLVSGSSSEAFDDVNLLQAKLSQQSTAFAVEKRSGGKSRSGKGDEDKEDCLRPPRTGKDGKPGKGKGGKGDDCQECPAAEDFCNSVINYVSDCAEYWSSTKDKPCSRAFCTVQDAMQTYKNERQVIMFHYQEASALAGACKTLSRQVEWGPADDRRTCPSQATRTTACSDPSTEENIKSLQMATFCDELEEMCDEWALWFIEAAGRRTETGDPLEEDGDRYSCKQFGAFNALRWAEAPGGCQRGTPAVEDWVNRGRMKHMNDINWKDEEDQVTTVNKKFEDTKAKRVRDESTLQWMLLDLESGCEAKSHRPAVKFKIAGSQEAKRQACFRKCQQQMWCMAVDIGIGIEDPTCSLFDWDCESPSTIGRESWRLHRGDSGVSKSLGGRLGCTQEDYQIAFGYAPKWSCPASLAKYEDKDHGCLLPDGPLAQCVCDANPDCAGLSTVYEDGFRVKYGTVKKLIGTGTGKGKGNSAYTCKKKCDEALTGTGGEGYRGCQTKTNSGKTCYPWVNGWYSDIDVEKSQWSYGDGFNHCRNPDGSQTIWCCTTVECEGEGDGWDYCTPKATQLLEVAAQEEARVEASDELHARASSNLSADALLDQVVSRKGCVEAC